MITIPTAELINGISAVLPITLDPKENVWAGVKVEWDGNALHFTTYDVYAGAVVTWVPGEGAEGDIDDEYTTQPEWGGNDAPWQVFISHADAKEILKLFKLPSKLWAFPVALKVNPTGSKLMIERNDPTGTSSNHGNRLLVLPSDRDTLGKIPDVRALAEERDDFLRERFSVVFNGARLAALAPSSMYGVLAFAFGENEHVGMTAGTRYAGFLYPAGVTPRRSSVLRDGAGVLVS